MLPWRPFGNSGVDTGHWLKKLRASIGIHGDRAKVLIYVYRAAHASYETERAHSDAHKEKGKQLKLEGLVEKGRRLSIDKEEYRRYSKVTGFDRTKTETIRQSYCVFQNRFAWQS